MQDDGYYDQQCVDNCSRDSVIEADIADGVAELQKRSLLDTTTIISFAAVLDLSGMIRAVNASLCSCRTSLRVVTWARIDAHADHLFSRLRVHTPAGMKVDERDDVHGSPRSKKRSIQAAFRQRQKASLAQFLLSAGHKQRRTSRAYEGCRPGRIPSPRCHPQFQEQGCPCVGCSCAQPHHPLRHGQIRAIPMGGPVDNSSATILKRPHRAAVSAAAFAWEGAAACMRLPCLLLPQFTSGWPAYCSSPHGRWLKRAGEGEGSGGASPGPAGQPGDRAT